MPEQEITPELLAQYLTIYVGESDWEKHLHSLWTRLHHDGKLYKQYVACTILLPTVTKLAQEEHAQALLFGITKFEQFKEKNWIEEFRNVVARDKKIKGLREKFKKLGWVEPLEFAPFTRQAYNWLYLKAENSGAINSPERKERIIKDFKRLVYIYGGAVICNIFTRHEKTLENVLNWRSGYFFERVVYDVYKPEEIYKIKRAELDGTNEKLIRKPRQQLVVSNF